MDLLRGPVLSAADLRRELAHLLPGFGIPARFVTLERVPRTLTGKILRNDLADVIAAREQ